MDIRELLEQRRRELYGYDDSVLENFGDITGEDDDEFFGDITMENEDSGLEEYFSPDELRQIDVEASMIDDPDEYIDNAIEEASADMIELVGESYINDLFLEDALSNCSSIDELEAVEESIKDTAVDFKNNAIKKVKALWSKFSAWIKNLFSSLKNQFTDGEKLLSKYGSELDAAYNKRKDKIKLKSYVYKIPSTDVGKDLEVSIKAAFYGMKNAPTVETNKSKIKKQYTDSIGAAGSGKKDFRKIVASKIRNDEKKEIKLNQISLDVIKHYAGGQKEAIKQLKSLDATQKDFFKTKIDQIKAVKIDDKDSNAKQEISAKVTMAKQGSAALSMGIKAYIAELKGANRACTGIVRKLLNKATSGGEMENRVHKKVKKRL